MDIISTFALIIVDVLRFESAGTSNTSDYPWTAFSEKKVPSEQQFESATNASCLLPCLPLATEIEIEDWRIYQGRAS
jgi:hypothetical protein